MGLFTRRCVVGIFSRESEESYRWLTKRLLKFVKDVRPVYISNSFMELKHDTERCDFAILYHSKNRGRLNVADVPDSLYDKELEYLSGTFGSNNVLVVIDDVEDGSDAAKSQILRSQPSIKRWATDLILFTQDEKSSPDNESARQKMNKMKRIIQGNSWYGTSSPNTGDSGSTKSRCACCNLPLLLMVLIILILVLLGFLVYYISKYLYHKNPTDTHASNLTNSSHIQP